MIGVTLVMMLQLGDLADFPAETRTKHAGLPREVRVLMDRRQACLYWGGEFSGDYSDPDPKVRDAQRIRDRQIIRTQNRLRCGIVEQEEARLRRRYATDSGVLRALDETQDWLP